MISGWPPPLCRDGYVIDTGVMTPVPLFHKNIPSYLHSSTQRCVEKIYCRVEAQFFRFKGARLPYSTAVLTEHRPPLPLTNTHTHTNAIGRVSHELHWGICRCNLSPDTHDLTLTACHSHACGFSKTSELSTSHCQQMSCIHTHALTHIHLKPLEGMALLKGRLLCKQTTHSDGVKSQTAITQRSHSCHFMLSCWLYWLGSRRNKMSTHIHRPEKAP